MKRSFLPAALFMLLALWPIIAMKNEVKDSPCTFDGFNSPIMCAEFLSNDLEVIRFFGRKDTNGQFPCVEGMVKAHSADNIFLILYSLFLSVFAFVAFRISRSKYLLLLPLLALFAAITDYGENQQILGLAKQIKTEAQNFEPFLSKLAKLTWLKWLSLGFFFLGISVFLWNATRHGKIANWFGKLLAIISISTCGLTALAWVTRSSTWENIMGEAFKYAFVGLLVFCFWFRKQDVV